MAAGMGHDRRVVIIAGYLFNYARSVYEKPDFIRLSLEQTREKRFFAPFPKDNAEFMQVVEKFLGLIGQPSLNPIGIKIIYARADAQEFQLLLAGDGKRHVLSIRSNGDHELAGYAEFAAKEPLFDMLGLSDPMEMALVKMAIAKIRLEHELFKTALDAKDPERAIAAVDEIGRRKNIGHLVALAIFCKDERVAMAAFENFAVHRMLGNGNAEQLDLDYSLSNIAIQAHCEPVREAARRIKADF